MLIERNEKSKVNRQTADEVVLIKSQTTWLNVKWYYGNLATSFAKSKVNTIRTFRE